MKAPYHVYTLECAAKKLGVDVDLLQALAETMEPEDGLLWLHDHTEDSRRAFTDVGIQNAAEQLSDPGIIVSLQRLMSTEDSPWPPA